MAAQTAEAKTLIDVQGFIYWDPDHANDPSHSYSGWELHPLTGWRLHGVSSPQFPPILSASPSKVTIFPGASSTSNITLTASNVWQSFQLNLTAKVSPLGPTATLRPATVTFPICNECSVTLSVLNITTTKGNSGAYNVTVIAGTGAQARNVTVVALVQGFTISASPPSLSVQAGSSGTSIITLTSISSFSGPVNLATSVIGCGCFTSALNSTSVMLSPGGSKTVSLRGNATSLTG